MVSEKCDFKGSENDQLTEHLKTHEGNTELKKENVKLKTELRALSDSYDRISSMYKKTRDDMKEKTNELKKELAEAQQNFRVAETENEKLRAANEIQNNLWKIWLEEHKANNQKRNEETKETEANKTDEGSTSQNTQPSEDVTDDKEEEVDESDDYEEIKAFLENKKRGFKRVNPSASSEPRPTKETINSASSSASATDSRRTNNRRPQTQGTVPYCHFWNNVGRCPFQNCRSSHEQAPICKFDEEKGKASGIQPTDKKGRVSTPRWKTWNTQG